MWARMSDAPSELKTSTKPVINRRDRLRGLSILAVTFVASLGISWRASEASKPEYSVPPAPATTVGIAGFPSAVAAVANLKVARGATRRDQLRGFVAEGVSVEGTLDTTRAGSRVRFLFQSKQGEGPQQMPEPGRVVPRVFCGKQNVHIDDRGIYAEADQPLAACTGEERPGLPEPACSMKDVWAAAVERGVERDRLARIEYFQAAAGPAWRFTVPGTTQRFTLTGDCQRELTGQDMVGGVR